MAFPKPTAAERLTSYVAANEKVLIQVAGNAMDENVNPGIMTSIEVLKILGTEHIAEVVPHEQGAAFQIMSDETPAEGYLRLLYLPDGQYAFKTDHPDEEKNTLRWEDADGCYVTVTKLTDCFFLEEAHLHS